MKSIIELQKEREITINQLADEGKINGLITEYMTIPKADSRNLSLELLALNFKKSYESVDNESYKRVRRSAPFTSSRSAMDRAINELNTFTSEATRLSSSCVSYCVQVCNETKETLKDFDVISECMAFKRDGQDFAKYEKLKEAYKKIENIL